MMAKRLTLLSSTQTARLRGLLWPGSGPGMIAVGPAKPAGKRRCLVITPVVVIRSTPAGPKAYHSAPSGPAVIPPTLAGTIPDGYVVNEWVEKLNLAITFVTR